MATTDDIHHLVTLARQHQWRIVAVGDAHQLPAVGRGGVFAHWTASLPAHHLHTPRRFEEEWEATASLGLRNGHVDAVDRLRTVHPTLVPTRVAALYQRHADAGRTVAITTNTAETARQINVEVQRQTHPRTRRSGVPLADGTRAGPGDHIATRRNQPDLRTATGHQVRNRHTWDVTATEPDGSLHVSHPDRGSVHLPADYLAQHVELGWAVTGYGNQGDTVDIGIAVLAPGTTRNHAYVALTRGRQTNLAYLTDPAGTAEPSGLLASIIERTPHHDSALAVDDALHDKAGVPAPDRLVDHGQPEPHPIDTLRARLRRVGQRPPPDRGLGL